MKFAKFEGPMHNNNLKSCDLFTRLQTNTCKMRHSAFATLQIKVCACNQFKFLEKYKNTKKDAKVNVLNVPWWATTDTRVNTTGTTAAQSRVCPRLYYTPGARATVARRPVGHQETFRSSCETDVSPTT